MFLVVVAVGATAGAAVPADAAPAAPKLVPAACATVVAGRAHCDAIQLVPAVRPNATPAAPTGYGPTDIQSAYNLGTNPGSGQVVAIVDAYDDPNAESDLATYRSQYGLPACTTANGCFRKVNQSGGTSYPSGDTGWGTEITLDLDAVSATCPGCHILLVETTTNDDNNLAAGVDEAVALGAKFVSNSYSDAESDAPSGINTHYNHPGVMIAAATGDNGSMSGTNTQYPASSPTVVAIGGTSLSRSSNARGWTETVWGSSGSGSQGTGSGCSATYAKPSYQSGITTGCNNRATSDVSADANPNTGLAIYDSYGQSGWLEYGGTSLATPIISSIWALAGAPASGDNAVAYPYAHKSSLNDVTSGSNGSCGAPICTAGTGWDGPTGLGTPNGTAAFVAGTTTTNDFSIALNPTSASVVAGNSATSTVSTAVVSGTPGTITLSASGLPSGATASFSPASVSAGSSSTLTVATSASTAAGTYPITVTGTAGGTSHTATYTLTVTTTAPSNDFSVSLSPATARVVAGGSVTSTVSTAVVSGTAGTITLSASGLPSGATASFSPASVTAGNSSTLTVATTASVVAGSYPITVTGTSGGTSHSATFTVTVTAPGGGGGVVTITNPGYQFGYLNLFGANFTVQATDSLGLPLTFTAVNLPPGVHITSGGAVSGVPTVGNTTYSVTVTATDSGGGSASTTFSYQVYGF
jgi:hypothetical protein